MPTSELLRGIEALESASNGSERPLTLALTPLKVTASVDRTSQPTVAVTVGGAPGVASAEPADALGGRAIGQQLGILREWPVPQRGPTATQTSVPATSQWRRAPSIRATPISQENARILCWPRRAYNPNPG